MDKEIKERIDDINSGIIPEGYKKTKVGIVPWGWEVIKAKEVFSNISNKKHNGDLEVLSSTQDKGIIPRSMLDIDIKYDKESTSNYKKVEKGNFVISLRSFQGGIEYSGYEGLISPAYTVLGSKVEIFDDYYKSYLKSPDYIQRLNTAVYGIRDGKNISYDDFSLIYIPYPPLPEQQKIAEILSTQDKLIELQEKKIEQLKELKKAYLQKMFPQKGSKYPELRFKGFTEPWEQRKLSDILERRVEHRQQSEEYPRLAFASGQGVIPLSERKTNNREQLTKDEFTKNYLVTELDDIVYNPANVKYGAIDRNKYGRGLISPIYITFTTAEIPGFIERIVSSHEFQQRALKFEEGTVIKRQSVNPNDFVTLKILLSPHREEQEKISALFDNLDSLITLHQRKSEQEKQKKKALMQLLLTGIVRTK